MQRTLLMVAPDAAARFQDPPPAAPAAARLPALGVGQMTRRCLVLHWAAAVAPRHQLTRRGRRACSWMGFSSSRVSHGKPQQELSGRDRAAKTHLLRQAGEPALLRRRRRRGAARSYPGGLAKNHAHWRRREKLDALSRPRASLSEGIGSFHIWPERLDLGPI